MGAVLLITGFGSFAGVQNNPSGELARALGQRPDCEGCELPVTFLGAPRELDRKLGELAGQPRGILCLGVHPGPSFRLEERAQGNFRGDRPDNDAVSASSLDLEGEIRSTTLDLAALEAALRRAGAQEIEQSADAGAFVCEAIYRHALWLGEKHKIPALFLHVPPAELLPVPEQLPLVSGLVDEFLRQTGS